MRKLFHAMNSSNQEYGTPNFITDEYLYLHINEYMHAQIKMDDEGVVIDMYPPQVVDEPIESTWCLYTDAKKNEEAKDNTKFKVEDVLCNEYGGEDFCKKFDDLCYVRVKNLNVQFQLVRGKKIDTLCVDIFDGSDESQNAKTLGGFRVKSSQFVEKP